MYSGFRYAFFKKSIVISIWTQEWAKGWWHRSLSIGEKNQTCRARWHSLYWSENSGAAAKDQKFQVILCSIMSLSPAWLLEMLLFQATATYRGEGLKDQSIIHNMNSFWFCFLILETEYRVYWAYCIIVSTLKLSYLLFFKKINIETGSYQIAQMALNSDWRPNRSWS